MCDLNACSLPVLCVLFVWGFKGVGCSSDEQACAVLCGRELGEKLHKFFSLTVRQEHRLTLIRKS